MSHFVAFLGGLAYTDRELGTSLHCTSHAMNEPSKDRSVADKVKRQLSELDASDTAYATRFVGTLLAGAQAADASDIHLTPNGAELDIRWRLDGVLQEVGRFPSGTSADVVSRLKVLAELLTYRTEVPQEGRVREAPGIVGNECEIEG